MQSTVIAVSKVGLYSFVCFRSFIEYDWCVSRHLINVFIFDSAPFCLTHAVSRTCKFFFSDDTFWTTVTIISGKRSLHRVSNLRHLPFRALHNKKFFLELNIIDEAVQSAIYEHRSFFLYTSSCWCTVSLSNSCAKQLRRSRVAMSNNSSFSTTTHLRRTLRHTIAVDVVLSK